MQHANTAKVVPEMDFRVTTTAIGTNRLAATELERNKMASANEDDRGHSCMQIEDGVTGANRHGL
jgi:hypothetical protein